MGKYKIISKPSYRAVGLKWDGPWSKINELKNIIHTMSVRVVELEKAVDPSIQLGLSYHIRKDGFTHYSVYEVTENQIVPEGMVEITVPAFTYILKEHRKGENIGKSYDEISQFLNDSDYRPFRDITVPYDVLPIKHERYPKDRDIEDPHFEILIPVVKKDKTKG
ncbi:GyrI-like domain-containing protein [Evansella sp. AB-P1]|uniref:GyrI-like domain-containing protein n=1 Tax=Evansella sp. AB-P1 TaxID=3037653 RepID=UPI00241D19D1|nr:GyrI-like domain-containing protein [Evansella sp. AB-P1]MDG5789087.1 GyrI-like domain-containing protein [Evansella sp. AB-P1]